MGHVVKPSNGWYQVASAGPESKKYRTKDTYTKEFWMPVLADQTFSTWVENRYLISNGAIMQDEVSSEDIAEAYNV